MEYVFTDGKAGLKNASPPKRFYETVDLYRNDRRTYEILLKEAKNVPNAKSNQDAYFAWLAPRVSTAQLSDFYIAYSDIENFCIKQKIISSKLFELTDFADIQKVASTVESNRFFRYLYKGNLSKFRTAMRLYLQFAEENLKSSSSTTSIKTPNTIPEAPKSESKPALPGKPKSATAEKPALAPSVSRTEPVALSEADTDNIVDFTTKTPFAFTNPTWFS